MILFCAAFYFGQKGFPKRGLNSDEALPKNALSFSKEASGLFFLSPQVLLSPFDITFAKNQQAYIMAHRVILNHFRFCASRAGTPLLGLGAGEGKCTKPKVVQYSYLLFLAAILTCTTHAQTHGWQRSNPGGGGAFSTIGAGASGIIIAGSDLSGAYRSLDHGQSWDVIGSNRGLTATHVSGIGFHPTDGDILYIGTDEGIFRSSDGGETVEQVLGEGYITDIEIARSNPLVGYAASHPEYDSDQGAVFKTTDGGMSWSQVSGDLPGGLRILKLLVHPADEDMLWLLSGEGRFACGPAQVWRSSNGGINWQQQASAYGEILDIGIDREALPYLYLTTLNADCAAQYYWTDLDGTFYKSTDLGDSWAPMEDRTGVIFVNADQPDIIRLIDPREPFPWIDGAGTWESADGGSTWEQTGFIADWDYGYQGEAFWSYGSSFNGISKTLGDDLSDPNNIYWTNSQWAFGSFDGGKNFQNLHTAEVSPGWWQSTGFDNVNMMDLAISEAEPDRIYLAYFDIGLWRSIDNGESWQSCNTPEYTGGWDGFGGNSATVLADPQRAATVWASMGGDQNGQAPTFLLRSDNGGERTSWQLSNNGLPDEEIMGLSLDRNSPADNRTLFVTAQGEVYKSENDGFGWTKKPGCNGCRFTAVDHFDSDLVFAGGENGLWRSTDGGETWSEAGLPEMGGDPDIGFWEWNWSGVHEIKTDPQHGGWVYVASFGNGKGLWRSTNGGDDWTKLLDDDFMRSMAISPQNADVLYATSSAALEAGGFDGGSHGILFSDDGGENWTAANEGMAWPFAVPVEVSKTDWVFVGSPGTGFQKAKVPGSVAVGEVGMEGGFEMYPNPNGGHFYLKIKNTRAADNMEVNVFNPIGKNVFSEKVQPGINSIQLGHLPKGLYFLKIKNGGKMAGVVRFEMINDK
ncbi:MAG TPA: T9SS type A sorting domain-containing protein [Bacteroidetes bacterium]|nr:T9SS type A sorting domain-containing protein [Bacteroidota bacterium]